MTLHQGSGPARDDSSLKLPYEREVLDDLALARLAYLSKLHDTAQMVRTRIAETGAPPEHEELIVDLFEIRW